MLLNMTIANFKSVKSPQTISFEAIKDNRLSESKVVKINEKLKAQIKDICPILIKGSIEEARKTREA